MSMKQVNLMHIFLIGPLLTYIGYKKEETELVIYNMLLMATLFLPFIVRFPKLIFDFRNIINSLHYLIYIPFFAYISLKKNNLNKNIYKLLILMGLSVIIIHIYLLLEKLYLL